MVAFAQLSGLFLFFGAHFFCLALGAGAFVIFDDDGFSDGGSNALGFLDVSVGLVFGVVGGACGFAARSVTGALARAAFIIFWLFGRQHAGVDPEVFKRGDAPVNARRADPDEPRVAPARALEAPVRRRFFKSEDAD